MLFTISKRRRRPTGFILSTLLHGGLFYLVVFSQLGNTMVHQHRPIQRHYSILVLRPLDFQAPRPSPPPASAQAAASAPGNRAASLNDPTAAQNPIETPALAEANSSPAVYRPFALPPAPHREPAKQTLVQLDVPPEIQLKQNIPLPTALIWEHLPPVRRNFIAPVARPKPKAMVEMPSAPDLSAPNWEPTVADLKLASAITTQNPKLLHPPAKTPPLSGNSPQPILEPPQISTSDPAGTSVAALISLPATPLVSDENILVPPANQIAASGSGSPNSTGTHGAGNGSADSSGRTAGHNSGNISATGTGGSNAGSGPSGSRGTAAHGSASAGAAGASSGAGSSSAGNTLASAASTAGGNGIAGAGSTGIGIGAPAKDPLDLPIPGTTRFTLPKDGKFSVVVAGSSLAGPYIESAGALSGKMVRSVYISVGLRKKWILQYCLPRAEEQKVSVRGRAEPLEAPWPYLIVRPDNIGTGDRDYVMVHGVLTPEGRFDQLALIFPAALDRKELLMRSLQQWTFRPANRDGVPSEIEILLIIPSQAE